MDSLMQAIDFDKEFAIGADQAMWAQWGWELIRKLFPPLEMPVEVGQRVETRVLVEVKASPEGVPLVVTGGAS